MARGRMLGVVVTVFAMGGALGACGSTGGAVAEAAPKEVALSADAIHDACWSAIVDLECAVTTSAEGDRFSSCDCTAEAEGDRAVMTVEGAKMDGSDVKATMELRRTADGWAIAPEE